MAKNPLDVLKSGLTNLKNLTKTREDDLLAHLYRKEKISAKEEEWLDNAANPVDEEAVVVLLEDASDYECRLTRLNSQQKPLVEKLKELSEKVVLAGKKRKSTRCIFPTKMKLTNRNRT
ncbi:hypothetical protein L208DRAFT_1347099 [Tricholoma matsutake]|nr:hypothetical protein L208DRAFT_1347099 [Tricholoma matsutake 945]